MTRAPTQSCCLCVTSESICSSKRQKESSHFEDFLNLTLDNATHTHLTLCEQPQSMPRKDSPLKFVHWLCPPSQPTRTHTPVSRWSLILTVLKIDEAIWWMPCFGWALFCSDQWGQKQVARGWKSMNQERSQKHKNLLHNAPFYFSKCIM